MYDLIIIGSGPAGCSAALYAVRSGLKLLVVSSGIGALAKAHKIENYYGLAQPLSGAELYQTGIKQAQQLGVPFVDEEVLAIESSSEAATAFQVHTTVNSYAAKSIILATGAAKTEIDLPGLAALEGKGVSYCAVCDGFFFRKKNVAVLGNGPYALHEAEVLRPLAAQVTLLTNGLAAPTTQLACNTKQILQLEGNQKLTGVTFSDGSSLALDGLFVALGTADSTALARKLGLALNGRYLEITDQMQTNLPGIFAAGDCTGGLTQIATAVSDGALAAMAALKFVRTGSRQA